MVLFSYFLKMEPCVFILHWVPHIMQQALCPIEGHYLGAGRLCSQRQEPATKKVLALGLAPFWHCAKRNLCKQDCLQPSEEDESRHTAYSSELLLWRKKDTQGLDGHINGCEVL